MEITKFNFIISIVSDEGNPLTIYVPQPPEMELKSLAPLLGRIFTALQKEEVSPVVLIKDWELILEELAEKNDTIKTQVASFFERSLLGVSVFTEAGKKIEKLSEDETNIFKGSLLFISALYRYSIRAVLGSAEMAEYFTSLTAMEFQNSLKTSSSQVRLVTGKKEG